MADRERDRGAARAETGADVKSYAPTRSIIICLVALSRGPLVANRNKWKFGRRIFSAAVVAELIAMGLAERIGDVVRMVG